MASNADILASLLDADFPASFTSETDVNPIQSTHEVISESPETEVTSVRKLSYDVDLFSKADEDDDVVKHASESSAIHTYLTDSSDDEDNKYFEDSKYNSFGRDIKNKIKDAELSKTDKLYAMLAEASNDKKKQANENVEEKRNPKQLALAERPIQKSNDVYADPIFGIRLINPLISSRGLSLRMEGKSAVKLSNLKSYLSCNSAESGDFVTAGAIVKAVTKLTRNGDQFMIWEISDLKDDLLTISVFLFGPTYNALWKTSIGTVVGILNPRQGKSENTNFSLTLNNADQVMIWGTSKDYGICKSLKKSGERCSSFVNKSVCEYCIYHMKKEYKKFSGTRSELQSPMGGHMRNVNLRNKVLGKNEVFYGGRSYTAVKPPAAPKVNKKDQNRLTNLGITVLENNSAPRQSTPIFTQQTRGREMMNRLASAPKEIKTVLMPAKSQSFVSKPLPSEDATIKNPYRAKLMKSSSLNSSKTDYSAKDTLPSSKPQPLSPNHTDNNLPFNKHASKSPSVKPSKLELKFSEIENAEPAFNQSSHKSSKFKSKDPPSGKYVDDSLSISSPVGKDIKFSKDKLKIENKKHLLDKDSPKLKNKKSIASEDSIPELFSSFDSVVSGQSTKSNTSVGKSLKISNKLVDSKFGRSDSSVSSEPNISLKSTNHCNSEKCLPSSNHLKNDLQSPKISDPKKSFSRDELLKSDKYFLDNPENSNLISNSVKSLKPGKYDRSFSLSNPNKSSKSNKSSLSNSNVSPKSKKPSLSNPDQSLKSIKTSESLSLGNQESLKSSKSDEPFSLGNPEKSIKLGKSDKLFSLSNPEESFSPSYPDESSRSNKCFSFSDSDTHSNVSDGHSKPSLNDFDKPFSLSKPCNSDVDLFIDLGDPEKPNLNSKTPSLSKPGKSVSDINRSQVSHRASSGKKHKSKSKAAPSPAPAKSRFDNLVKMDVSNDLKKKVDIEKTVLSSRVLTQESKKTTEPSCIPVSDEMGHTSSPRISSQPKILAPTSSAVGKIEVTSSPKVDKVPVAVKPPIIEKPGEIKKSSSDFADNPNLSVLMNRKIPPSPPPQKMSKAKMRAIQIVKQQGVSPQSPTTRAKLLEEAVSQKRKREDDPEDSEKPVFSELFMELMKKGTKHIELVDMELMRKEEEYFERMGMKEALEEKMLNTFKVDCKAVKCLKCKYTWFSSSDMCKAQGHPLKVVDAVKRFFQCKDCGNRTIALTVFPLISCRQCEGSNWVRAAMIREKVCKNNEGLSIRGGEQKFFNGAVTNANLNLLVPE